MPRYYVVVRACRQADISIRSGYYVESPDEENKARKLFSQDTGYEFDDTKICWKRIDPEPVRFKCFLQGKFPCRSQCPACASCEKSLKNKN